MRRINTSLLLILILSLFGMLRAQTQPPAPGSPKAVSIPTVASKELANGLTVGVVRKASSPLVTVRLVVKNGAGAEATNKAGLADITASMLTKGTKTKTATQIAESVEFLGGSIFSGAGWNGSFVAVTVTSDKLPQAMSILADVVLNPKFAQDELDLLKSQTLDGLTYSRTANTRQEEPGQVLSRSRRKTSGNITR
jgi:zinc protease